MLDTCSQGLSIGFNHAAQCHEDINTSSKSKSNTSHKRPSNIEQEQMDFDRLLFVKFENWVGRFTTVANLTWLWLTI